MKKILLPFLIWVTVVTANEPTKFLKLDPFRTSVDSNGLPIGLDVWVISTDDLVGNQIIGQFYRIDKRPPQQFLFAETEVDNFLSKYANEFLVYGPGNYFLVQKPTGFILLSVERIGNNFIKHEYSKYNQVLIPEFRTGFMKIYLPRNSNES